MNDCWYVLALAILATDYCTPEMAFVNLGNGAMVKHNNTLTNADFEDMLKLKEDKLTYKEIGDIYGLEESNVFRKMKKYKMGVAI